MGAGRKTNQKSATRAMTTLAATKSISFLKLSRRFVYSAEVLVNRPMPTCQSLYMSHRVLHRSQLVSRQAGSHTSMATFTMKLGSASNRSRIPLWAALVGIQTGSSSGQLAAGQRVQSPKGEQGPQDAVLHAQEALQDLLGQAAILQRLCQVCTAQLMRQCMVLTSRT